LRARVAEIVRGMSTECTLCTLLSSDIGVRDEAEEDDP